MRNYFAIFPSILVISLLLLQINTSAVLAIKLTNNETVTISNGELGFGIGRAEGKIDAKQSIANNNNTSYFDIDACIRTNPDALSQEAMKPSSSSSLLAYEHRQFCIGWAAGYVAGWKNITGQKDIDLPAPFP